MKKILTIVLIGIFILSGFGAIAIPNHGSDTFTFYLNENAVHITLPSISYEIIQKNGLHEIFVENFGRLSNPGEPCLPSKISRNP